MELRPGQLQGHLNQGELASIYLLAGDEPLLVLEAADALRHSARAAGYDERQVLHVEAGFDWNQLAAAGDSLSLFAQRRIIEIHLPDKGPGKDGSAALIDYARNPPPDTVLIVLATPLPARQRHDAWYRQLSDAGVVVFAWPVTAAELPAWISQRARSRKLSLDDGAVAVLAERAEGNLLAAAQEIDRLALLYPDTRVDAAAMLQVSADSARFDIFDLGAKALAGDGPGVIRSAARLREEGVDPVPILWSLVNDLRTLQQIQGGGKTRPMPPHRKRLLGAAARRIKRGRVLRLLWLAAHADQVNKGAARGYAWAELVTLALGMAGIDPPRSPLSATG